jgi:hypothetical protein
MRRTWGELNLLRSARGSHSHHPTCFLMAGCCRLAVVVTRQACSSSLPALIWTYSILYYCIRNFWSLEYAVLINIYACVTSAHTCIHTSTYMLSPGRIHHKIGGNQSRSPWGWDLLTENMNGSNIMQRVRPMQPGPIYACPDAGIDQIILRLTHRLVSRPLA